MWQAERRGTEGMGTGTATVHEQTWKKSTILHADSLFGNHDMVQRPAIRRAELRQPPRFLPSWPVLDTERTKTGDKIEFLSNFKTAPRFQRLRRRLQCLGSETARLGTREKRRT
jgi:hypothetical protein